MAKNARDPDTGNRFSGRARKSWGYNPDRDEYYVPGSQYDPGHASIGLDNASSGTDAASDGDEASGILFETGERVIVERNATAPKETKRVSRGPGKPKGAITPQHVSAWVQMGMASVAMYRNSKIWLIQDPKVEIDPWAPSAAELLNKIPQEYAEKVTELSAVGVVAMGLFNMVSVRLQAEHLERMERARDNAANMQAEEFAEYSTTPASQARTYTANGSTAPSGASAVGPEESIFGNTL